MPGSWQSAVSAPGTPIGAGKVSFVLKHQQQTAQVTRLLPAHGIFSDLKGSSTKKKKEIPKQHCGMVQFPRSGAGLQVFSSGVSTEVKLNMQEQ